MSNFKKGGFRQRGGGSGGRSKFGGNRFRGGRDRGGRPELFPAVCSECGKSCEVPFRPTGDKPVYCRDCFGKQRRVPGRNSNGADGPREDFQRDVVSRNEYQPEYTRPQNIGFDTLKRQLDSLESKLNRILEFVSKKAEAPTPITPIIKVVPQVPKEAKEKTFVRKVVTKRKK